MCLLEHRQQAHPDTMMESVCIRPGYVWPAQASHLERQLLLCSDEGIALQTGTTGRQFAGLFSGCGPAGVDVAVVASQILAGALAPQMLHNEQYTLAPAAIEAAFEQCHQQLLQLQPQQHPAVNHGPGSTLDTATSGASALVLALDQSQSKLLVASAGLCKAVLARSSPAGNLTVMELTPRLALGHDSTETARLDAAGSSICYQTPPAATDAGCGSLPASGGSSNEAATHSHGTTGSAAAPDTSACCSSHDGSGTTNTSSVANQPVAVLVTPDGSVLQHVGASRLLGCSAATCAGVLPTPVVTSWRLHGSESFVVLGSPGLWQAMNPAEVVDYVAAALASGISSSSGPTAAAGEPLASSSATAAAAAAVSVGDLLTLEAQERLKLQLMDKLFGLCPGPAAPSAAGCLPDVSAVVLLMPGSPALHAVAVDQQKMKQELAGISRACRSNAEAQALQALWSASCFCCDRALAGAPSPALSSLLPALSVAGHCWPSTFWPAAKSIVAPQMLLQQQHGKPLGAAGASREAHSSTRSAAECSSAAAAAAAGRGCVHEDEGDACDSTAVASDDSSGRLSLVDAAVAAGIVNIGGAHAAAGDSSSFADKSAAISRTISASSAGCTRATAFALSSRLSCELDLSHDHGSSGSCGCLAGECSSSLTSPAVQQQQQCCERQAMILHKVRLAGPCELESLLFANPTTPHPDTTVARILKPSNSMSSWPSVEVLSPSAAALERSNRSVAAGGVHMRHHAAPQRSASVSIGSLAMRRSTRHSAGSSHSSSGGWSSLREAAAAADSAYLSGKRSSSSWGRDSSSQGTLLAASSSLYSPSRAAADTQQMQQQDVLQMQMQQEQQQMSGTVKRARSYQALSALHAGMRAATSLPAQQALAGSATAAASSSIRSNTVRRGYSLAGAQLAAAAAAAAAGALPKSGGGTTFRSAFSNAGEVGHRWSAAAEAGSWGSKGSAASTLQRAWTASDSPCGLTPLQLQLQRSSSQQQQQSLGVAMPLSCPVEGLGAEATADDAACEGKVRRGISRDRRMSSTRLIAEQEAAAATAANAPQDALGQAAEKQGDITEGKVRGGSRRCSFRRLSDDAEMASAASDAMHSSSSTSEVLSGLEAAMAASLDAEAPAAAAAAGATWQSKLKGAADKASRAAFKAASSVGQPFSSNISSSSSKKRDTVGLAGTNEQQPQQRHRKHSQLLPQGESSVRGGQAKAARLRSCASTSDLTSLAAARAAADAAFDQAAVSAVRANLTFSGFPRSSWDGASSSSAASSAAAAAAPRGIPSRITGMGKKLPKLLRKPHPDRDAGSSSINSSELHGLGAGNSISSCSILTGSSGANSRGSSIEVSFSAPQGPAGASPRTAATAAAGSAGLAAFAEASVHGGKHNAGHGRLVSPFGSAAGTAAAAGSGDGAAGCLDSSRAASNCPSEVVEAAAGGAVHGGELGATALEGQMHGGRRSSSLNLTSSMLLGGLSLTSSGGDDADYANGSHLSSPSQQLPTSLFNNSGSFAESSSPLQRHQNSLEAAANAAAAAAAAVVPWQLSPEGASCDNVGGSAATLPAASAAGSAELADRMAPGIQVLRMHSGSFTRVRLAVSAPAGGAEGGNSLAGSRDVWSPEPMEQQGATGDSSSRQRQYVTSCVQLQHYSSATGLGDNPCGVEMPKPHPAMRRATSSGGIVHHAASIGTELPSMYSSSSKAGGGGWSSSRAWGTGAGSRPNAIQFGKVPLPGPFSAAAAAAAAASGSKTVMSPPRGSMPGVGNSSSSSSAGSTMFRSAFKDSRSAGDSNTSSPQPKLLFAGSGPSALMSSGDGLQDRPQQQQQPEDEASRTGAAAAAAAETAYELLGMQSLQPVVLSGVKWQKSMGLPTLQESPATTPGTSPQLSGKVDGATAAAAAAAARDIPQGPSLGLNDAQLQAVQLQQQLGLALQQQQWIPNFGNVELEPHTRSATAESCSSTIVGSFEEDHSLTGFLADVPEDRNRFEGFAESGESRESVSGSSAVGVSYARILEHSGSEEMSGQQQQQQPDSPPRARRDGRSFEFSRPHTVFGMLHDSSSPAHVGNSLQHS